MEEKRKNALKRYVVDALFLAILCVCAQIAFNFGQVPVTLQVFAVILIIYLTEPIDALIIIALYVLMGLVGIPVFSGFRSGFVSPGSGFIIGFVLSAIFNLIFSLIIKKKEIKDIYLVIIKALSFIIIIYLAGIPYFMLLTKWEFGPTIVYFLPFIGIDILKIVIAAFIYERLKNVMNLIK